MGNDYEQRVRKGLDDLIKLDPELAALDREETIKDVAAGLKKAEAAWRGRGSQWPGTWELVKTPFSGRLNGVEVERGLWPWGLILVKYLGLIVAPVFGLLQLLAFWGVLRWWWKNARANELGVEIFSALRGTIHTCAWSEIVTLRRIGHGPTLCPQLTLASGEIVEVPLADWATLEAAAAEHAVAIDDPWK